MRSNNYVALSIFFTCRKGSESSREGVFDVNDSIQKILDELNIDGDDDLIITKEIFDNGRSTIKIQLSHYLNSALKQVAPAY